MKSIASFSSVVSDFLGSDVTVDIDDIFPLKTLLLQNASGCIYRNTSGEKTTRYINVPVAYYGGGTNLCVVDYSKLSDSKQIFKSSKLVFLTSSNVPPIFLNLNVLNKPS